MSTDSKSNTPQGSAGRYLSFSLVNEEYAIPLLSVREVIALPEVTPLPFTPPYFLGLMNLRGQVISVIDLRAKLGMKPDPKAETSVIICDLAPLSLGVVVDSINSVLTPDPDHLSDKPDIHSSKATDYILSVYRRDKQLVLILDIAKALSVEDQIAIAKAAQNRNAA